MSHPPELFSASFWEEVSELDELGRRAYSNYLLARDALFARYGQKDADNLPDIWRRYCESAQLLERTLLEAHRFVGTDREGS